MDRDLYIIEPRFEDGSLNVKQIGSNLFGEKGIELKNDYSKNYIITHAVKGVNEQDLFNLYFSNFPDVNSVGWDTVREFYKSFGLYIRKKTW